MNHRWLWGSRQNNFILHSHTHIQYTQYEICHVAPLTCVGWFTSPKMAPDHQQPLCSIGCDYIVTRIIFHKTHIVLQSSVNCFWWGWTVGFVASGVFVLSQDNTQSISICAESTRIFWQNLQFKHSTLVILAYFMQNRELINEIVDIDNYNIWLRLYCCIEITRSLLNYTLIKGYTPWWRNIWGSDKHCMGPQIR